MKKVQLPCTRKLNKVFETTNFNNFNYCCRIRVSLFRCWTALFKSSRMLKLKALIKKDPVIKCAKPYHKQLFSSLIKAEVHK